MTINVSVLNNGCAPDTALKIVPLDANGNRLEDQARIIKGREFDPYVTVCSDRSFLLEEIKL